MSNEKKQSDLKPVGKLWKKSSEKCAEYFSGTLYVGENRWSILVFPKRKSAYESEDQADYEIMVKGITYGVNKSKEPPKETAAPKTPRKPKVVEPVALEDAFPVDDAGESGELVDDGVNL